MSGDALTAAGSEGVGGTIFGYNVAYAQHIACEF